MHQLVPNKIIHFHNGAGGGVLSVIRNLLAFRQHSEIENHVIYTVNRDLTGDYKIPGLDGAASEQVFYFSPKWNFYYTCQQLTKLILSTDSVIIAHDWLELGMVSNLGLSNPVVMIVHGDYLYYYDLAVKHADNIDIFICIASEIKDKLTKILPSRHRDIYYQRFPVKNPLQSNRFGGIKKLIFIGRCEKGKGYDLLPLIEEELRRLSCEVEWTIVGDGSEIEKVQWSNLSHIHFLKVISNEEVLKILPDFDLILLPSLAEGMPVSIIEAMKSGVIPIVNDISGGIQELIEDNITGYKVRNNNPAEYAEIIQKLSRDSELVNQVSLNCINRGTALFNPVENTLAFEELFKQASMRNKKKKKIKVYGSRLDKSWIPNTLVSQIRKCSNKMNTL